MGAETAPSVWGARRAAGLAETTAAHVAWPAVPEHPVQGVQLWLCLPQVAGVAQELTEGTLNGRGGCSQLPQQPPGPAAPLAGVPSVFSASARARTHTHTQGFTVSVRSLETRSP